MSDRQKYPPQKDFAFYQRRKHDRWNVVPVPEPVLEAPIADSHAHLHILHDPAWELKRCAVNGVDFVCAITDLSEDGVQLFDNLDQWILKAGNTSDDSVAAGKKHTPVPEVRIAVGVHPHNAKLYTAKIETELFSRCADLRVVALGEIGLDYHYDLSPRDVQRNVFRRQIVIAQEQNLPIVLHLRNGKNQDSDNAYSEAFEILKEVGVLGQRVVLHCCTLSPEELMPWVQADCYIAYGGALTFKNADTVREGVRLVPHNRLLLETDAPYMAPEPMRGTACTPAHVIFVAAALARACDISSGDKRRVFLEQIHLNTLSFFGF